MSNQEEFQVNEISWFLYDNADSLSSEFAVKKMPYYGISENTN